MILRPAPADAIAPRVIIQDLILGRGRLAMDGDEVVVHFVARLLDGFEFASSRELRKPVSFVLGMMGSEAVPGLHEGLKGMRTGGMRKLTIPAEFGYGAAGTSTVPPGSTLVYDVELLRVT